MMLVDCFARSLRLGVSLSIRLDNVPTRNVHDELNPLANNSSTSICAHHSKKSSSINSPHRSRSLCDVVLKGGRPQHVFRHPDDVASSKLHVRVSMLMGFRPRLLPRIITSYMRCYFAILISIIHTSSTRTRIVKYSACDHHLRVYENNYV